MPDVLSTYTPITLSPGVTRAEEDNTQYLAMLTQQMMETSVGGTTTQEKDDALLTAFNSSCYSLQHSHTFADHWLNAV